MQDRTYQASGWAVQRWDRFNEGRLVTPKSFCQFWRAVLLYMTVSQLLLPVRVVDRFCKRHTAWLDNLNISTPRFLKWVSTWVGTGLCNSARGLGRGFWLLLYPLRWGLPPVGRAAVAGVVIVGEPIDAFGQRNREVLGVILTVLAVLTVVSLAVFYLLIAFFASWFWTLITLGSLVGGGFALYGLYKSGVLPLLWGAAVAAKHGVCPPVEIAR